MTTLVTGATGFLGSAVARALLDAGHAVRVLMREGADTRNIDGLEVERAVGDLTERRSLERAAQGCDTLFHVAADYRLWIPDPPAIYRTNVEGSRDLLRAAAEAGATRIVYTSSVATLGLNADRTPADEETPVTEAAMIGHYKRSKYLAEEAVRALVRDEGVPAVIVNPSAPIGPRDIKPTPTGRIIVDFATGRMPAYVDTGLNVVHVDDCAAGHLQALAHGAVGERYILGGENMSLREILECLAPLAGRPAPRVRLSAPGVGAGGRRGRDLGAAGGRRAAPHPRQPAHGAQDDVLLVGEGRTHARLQRPPRRAGAGRRARLVSGQRLRVNAPAPDCRDCSLPRFGRWR